MITLDDLPREKPLNYVTPEQRALIDDAWRAVSAEIKAQDPETIARLAKSLRAVSDKPHVTEMNRIWAISVAIKSEEPECGARVERLLAFIAICGP